MKLIQKAFDDKMYLTGMAILALVACIGFLPLLLAEEQAGFQLFLPCFFLTVIYLVFLLISGRLRKGRNGLPLLFIFLVMALISCFKLNEEMEIFHISVNWLSVLIVVSCINYLFVFWFEEMPAGFKLLHVMLLSVSLLLFFYLAIYLVPQYIFSIAVGWLLGISLHSFVPLLFVIYTLMWLLRIFEKNKMYAVAAGSAAAFAMAGLLFFMINWFREVDRINQIYQEAQIESPNSVPAWTAAAARIPANGLTEKILKTDSRFGTAPNLRRDDMLWNAPSVRRNEEMNHDPLIMIATFFGGRLLMEKESRIKMLGTVFNKRHQSEERLWSGESLYTENVDTRIRIWPQYRISYTDQQIKIKSRPGQNRWEREEEAIYSFHLPEGAVVTTLSLWIGGKESPGILTTRSQADSAYKTVVGVEVRDPSVVHWQEGNRVSVRVFPVTPDLPRKFRIGYTAPLSVSNNRLTYKSSWFEGPPVTNAKGGVSVEMMGHANVEAVGSGLTFQGKGIYNKSNSYDPDMDITLDAGKLNDNTVFSFNGNEYAVQEFNHNRTAFAPQTVYLDINNAWSKDDLDKVLLMPGMQNTFVWLNGKTERIHAQNKYELLASLQEQQFSLFPLQAIKDPASALLITKNHSGSPQLNELKGSEFYNSLKSFLATRPKIRLFCIGGELSPYLRSLKEYRVFDYEQGSIDDCSLLLVRKEFAQNMENDQQVAIEKSNLIITRKPGERTSDAPDHLMRLFAYNHIMQQAGTGWINGEGGADSLVAEAANANIVTPVSSLVVLESKEDYERFDIKKSKDALGNAAAGSKGAVPEPHEWVLIIMGLLLFFILKFKLSWKLF